MKKDRSNYNVQVNCDANTINNLMQSFIASNGFKMIEKKGEQYYRAGDAMLGYKGLKYNIDGQNLAIEAWLDGAFGDFPIDVNNLNTLAMSYRNSLNILFQEINKLNNGGDSLNNEFNNVNSNNQNTNINNEQPMQQSQNNINQFAQTFQDETTKKQEKQCEIGFWLSILGFACALFGVSYGIIIYIMNFYFASQGLKTKKRGKAIATIVLSIISILIIIIELILKSVIQSIY